MPHGGPGGHWDFENIYIRLRTGNSFGARQLNPTDDMWKQGPQQRPSMSLDCAIGMDSQYLDSSSGSDSSPANAHLPFRRASQGVRTQSPNHRTQQMEGSKSLTHDMSNHPDPMQFSPEQQNSSQRFILYDPTGVQSERSLGSPISANAAEQLTDSTVAQEKRRAQNRSAQRAFRVRKLQKVKTLEQTLVNLLSKHNDLLTSYGKQENELAELRNRISNLQNELAQLRVSYGRDQEYGGMVAPEQSERWDFDAFLAANYVGDTQHFGTDVGDDTASFGKDFAAWSPFDEPN